MKKYSLILVLLLQSVLFSDEYCAALSAFEADNLLLAKETIDPLAFKGDSKSQNLLGLINLEMGNNRAGQKWLQSAAMKDNARAAYNLGVYFYSLGNNHKAEEWVHKGESLTQSKLALGFLYTMKDMRKSKEYFALAAKEGSAFASSHLCAILAMHQTPADNQYVNLCQGNVVNDLYETGKFYTSEKQYGSVNKAIYYLQPAADKGHVKAMNLLGEMLYKRRGPSDEANALKYFQKAADLGNVDAKVNAAWIYYTGVRWTRKPELGFQMLTRAVNRGNARAKFYMGVLYTRPQTVGPDSVTRNVPKGLDLIKEAARQNDKKAMQYMIKNGASQSELQSYQKQLRKYHKQETQARALHFLYEGC